MLAIGPRGVKSTPARRPDWPSVHPVMRRFQWWWSADPRAMGLFRIALGLLALCDVLRRVPYITVFYSNDGVLTNHFTLFRPHARYTFSLLFGASRPAEVAVFFAFAIFCLVCFTIGWRTKLFQVLSAVCIWSIHGRNILLENGGDVVLNLWFLWTLFLPLGARFSVDSVRRSLAARDDKSPAQIAARPPPERTLVRSVAVTAVLLQLCVIYFFNTVSKSGAAWSDGTAVAWVLEQDRIVTGLGLIAREHLPLWVFKAMTWGTLVIEGAAPLLLLSPVATTWTRRVAFLTLASLHLGIYLLTDVGLFSPTMVVAFILLLTPPDIELLARWLTKLAGPPIVVWFDSDCGVCTWCARVGARLDRLDRTTWAGRDREGPPGLADFEALQDHTIIVWSPEQDRVWTEAAAVARVVRAMPGGALFAWVLRVPGLASIILAGYRWFSPRRHAFSAWVGMGVCGVGGPAQAAAAPPEPTRASRALGRARWVLGELVLVFFLVAAATQVLIENKFVRDRWRVTQPSWARAAVQYPRIYQGWSMFAPDAPRRDGHMVIDAVLEDGTHVDPQTGEAPVLGVADAHSKSWGQLWGSYSMRVAAGRNSHHREGLRRWLLEPNTRHLELPADKRIVSFTAWWIGDESPDPRVGGEPREVERRVVVQAARKKRKRKR